MNSYLHRRIMMLGMSVVVLGMFGGVALGQATFVSRDIDLDFGNSFGSAMGDVNGDGYLDIYVANYNDNSRIWMNDGLAIPSFADSGFNYIGPSNDVIMGDVNGDAYLDIYVGNQGASDFLWINNGAGSFPAPITLNNLISGQGMSMGDVENDGDLDIYVANGPNEKNRLWINSDGQGNFVVGDIPDDTAVTYSYDSIMGDVTGDGHIDIFVANFGSNQNRLFINDGQGNFSLASNLPQYTETSLSAVMGDVNNDTYLDIYIGTTDQNILWINDGVGNFIPANIPNDDNAESNDVIMGDVDSDGDLDIYVANAFTDQNRLWINSDGQGNFVGNNTGNMPNDTGFSNSATMGDVDNDGDLDIYVANTGGEQNRLWINQTIVNDIPPVAVDDTATVQVGSTVTTNVIANDTVGDTVLDPVSVVIATQPTQGSVAVNPTTGVITYTPSATTGTFTYTYTVADMDGDVSNVATVTVTVNPANATPPNVINDTASITQGVTSTVNVLANDSDSDGIDTGSVTVTTSSPASGPIGTVNANGSITFDATNAAPETYTYTYTVSDVNGATSSGTITLTVNASGNNGGNNNNTTVTTLRRGSFTRRTLEFVQDTLTPKPLEVATSLACPVIIEIPLSRDVSGGMDVKILQGMLNFKNNAGLVVDGVFGPLTQNAVMRYQSMNTFSTTGIVDMQTYQRLICNI